MQPHHLVERGPKFVVRRRTVDGIDVWKSGNYLASPAALIHPMDFVFVVDGNGLVPTSTEVLANHGRDSGAVQPSAETTADFDVTPHVQFDAVPEQFQESTFLIVKTPLKALGRIDVP